MLYCIQPITTEKNIKFKESRVSIKNNAPNVRTLASVIVVNKKFKEEIIIIPKGIIFLPIACIKPNSLRINTTRLSLWLSMIKF